MIFILLHWYDGDTGLNIHMMHHDAPVSAGVVYHAGGVAGVVHHGN